MLAKFRTSFGHPCFSQVLRKFRDQWQLEQLSRPPFMGISNTGPEIDRPYVLKILIRSGSVRGPFGVRSGPVRGPFGVRSGSVRALFGVRSGFVRSVRGPSEVGKF